MPNLVKLTGVEDGREHVWSRTKAAFRHIYEHHIDDYDWFMRVDDDGYIVLENLRFFLLAYDPDEKVWVLLLDWEKFFSRETLTQGPKDGFVMANFRSTMVVG